MGLTLQCKRLNNSGKTVIISVTIKYWTDWFGERMSIMTLTPRISIATMMTVLPLKGEIFFKKDKEGFFTTSDLGPKLLITLKNPAEIAQMLKEFNFMIDEHTVDADDNELIRYTDLSLVNA